jgi:hypothetical protein
MSRIRPDVVRSLVGLFLLVLGVITLIALALPGEGTLTTWWRDFFAPWFGTGRWALPFVLLAAGFYVERASGPGRGWGVTLACLAIIYVAALAILSLLDLPDRSGGRIGSFVGDLLASLVSTPGAIVILLAVVVGASLVMLDRSLGSVLGPLSERARAAGGALRASMATEAATQGPGDATARAKGRAAGSNGGAISKSASPGQSGIWGPDGEAARASAIPSAVPSVGPMSARRSRPHRRSVGRNPCAAPMTSPRRPTPLRPVTSHHTRCRR